MITILADEVTPVATVRGARPSVPLALRIVASVQPTPAVTLASRLAIACVRKLATAGRSPAAGVWGGSAPHTPGFPRAVVITGRARRAGSGELPCTGGVRRGAL
jgi:hypothetical protein